MGSDKAEMRHIAPAFLFLLSLFLGLFGIRWGLPSQERLLRVLPLSAIDRESREKMEVAWKEMYVKLGPEPIMNPNIFSKGFSGSLEIAPSWSRPPKEITASTRSFFLRSSHEDEAPIIVSLSRINRKNLNPRIYTYGGAYLYTLGMWISVLTHPPRSLNHLMAHPEDMARIYLSGRLFSVAAYVFGTLLLYWIGKKLWNEKVGFWAALFYAVSPGIVLGAHTMKPQMMGMVCVMGVFYFCAKYEWMMAGVMIGLATGVAPYLGLCAMMPVIVQLQHEEVRRDIVLLDCAFWAVAVFLATNPFFLTSPKGSFMALREFGKASAFNLSYVWKFPMTGFIKSVSFLSVFVILGLVHALVNWSADRALGLALFSLLFYFAMSWMLQTPDSMIGARNWPAFFLAFLIAGVWISKSGIFQAFATVAVMLSLAYSLLICYNLHVDSTQREAGEWIEAHIPKGSELGFLNLPQPSNVPYFQWNKYHLKFFEKSSTTKLPEFLILTSPSYNATEGMYLPDSGYHVEKDFKPKSLGPMKIEPGSIYGNPLVEIYKGGT